MTQRFQVRNSAYGLLVSDGRSVLVDERSLLMSDGTIRRSEGLGWTICKPKDIWEVATELEQTELVAAINKWFRRIASLPAEERCIVVMAMAKVFAGVDKSSNARPDVWNLIDSRLESRSWELVRNADDSDVEDVAEFAHRVLEDAGRHFAGLLLKAATAAKTAAEMVAS
jgi:hypothetical protein